MTRRSKEPYDVNTGKKPVEYAKPPEKHVPVGRAPAPSAAAALRVTGRIIHGSLTTIPKHLF